jgi:hypothetical protein
MELWIKRYGSRSFQGQNGLFKRIWGNSGFFEVVGGFLSQKTGALAKFGFFLSIFVDFWSV